MRHEPEPELGSRGASRETTAQALSMTTEAVSPHPSIAVFVRFLLKLFFGRIEVQGLERVPSGGPLVYVANHVNSLIDPALLVAFMPRAPRFLATSELWRIPILKPFLPWAAAIPVYRPHVVGSAARKNLETFARCHEVLAAGGAIGILPEGTSHNEPALVPIRSGASRIVLEAEERFGGLGTRIVPVGFTFEDRTRFRSSVLVEVGEPIDPAPEIALYRREPRAAVKVLTGRVREALLAVTLNFPSWDEAGLIEQAAEIYERPAGSGAAIPLVERVALRRAFVEGYGRLKAERPEEVEAVASAVRRYDAALERTRLRDEQVAAVYRPGDVARFVAWSLWLLLIRLPLGAVGLAVHWLPFQAASFAARRLPETADRIATYKVLASLVFYPVTWVALAAAAGWAWGWPAALGALVLGPLTGGFALRLYLRGRLLASRLRALLLLRRGKLAELRRLRGEAERAIERLVALYSGGSPPPGSA